MSIFQCERCGCAENTALSSQGFKPWPDHFDWTGIEDRRGMRLCSVCGPTKYSDGTPTEYGKWHERKTRDVAAILHFLTPKQMAEEIVRLDAALAALREVPQADAPSLSAINELAKVYATSYATPHHITFTVQGLRHMFAAMSTPQEPHHG